MSTFSERVVAAREQVKLKQTELAVRVGVTPGAINKIESGETKGAKPSTLAALARALGVSMEWLATGKEGYVLEPQGEYASGQVYRLLSAWGGGCRLICGCRCWRLWSQWRGWRIRLSARVEARGC